MYIASPISNILTSIAWLVTTALWRNIIVGVPTCIVTRKVTNIFALRSMRWRTLSLSFIPLLLICIRTAVWIVHIRIHHWVCGGSRWIAIGGHWIAWHWRMRRRKHVHREVYVYTCVSRIRVTWMFFTTCRLDICWGFSSTWRDMFCFLLSCYRRNRWHGRHIVRMIRPMIRHRIVKGLLMELVFLFVRIILVDFFVWWPHIKLIVHLIIIRIVVIRRHSFMTFRIVFIVLSVLVISSFVCLVVLLRSELLVFVRVVSGVHRHWRIVIRISLHSWI